MNIRFSTQEIRDLLIAWLALGLAFTFFYSRVSATGFSDFLTSPGFVYAFVLSLVTAGVGFLLHELAHKVVAVKFGQLAEFRADFGMLFLAVAGGLAGFLFAAPGAVHHRGRITKRENGLIAVAGPVTNLALAALFLVPALVAGGLVGQVGWRGVSINLLLAGFNMIPFGPLDGRTVLDWSKLWYAVVAIPSIGLAALLLFA
ncbi:metalloprotease [Halospeciosus flavus]|uniref:Metalloprotease n=1 Tax=Halospeciosus flavus TaxID=3032283 RepID=A0ABD5Z3F9_9EURY|nr:metalloprotease [Halospeciosus flavus]